MENNSLGISFTIPLSEEDIEKIKNTTQKVQLYINSAMSQEEYFKHIIDLFKQIENNTNTFIIAVYNRESLKKSNLLSFIPKNVTLKIENENYRYTLDEYIKEEELLEEQIQPIRDSNLSPLEKYLAVYDIVKKFKPYQKNNENDESNYKLRYILNNKYYTCMGFSNLLKTLLDKVGISSKMIDSSGNKPYRNDYDQKTDDEYDYLHERILVRIDDEKYNIHGYYLADPTWDSDEDLELYIYSLITFDRLKELRELEKLEDYDLLFDFHKENEGSNTFEDEFQRKTDFLFERTFLKESIPVKDKTKCFRKTIRIIYNTIMYYLYDLDFDKYLEFYNKYNIIFYPNIKTIEDLNNPKIDIDYLLTQYKQLLNDWKEYIIPLSNNEIPLEVILNAVKTVKKAINNYTEEEAEEYYKNAKEDCEETSKIEFPYKYNPNNKKEAFLKSR